MNPFILKSIPYKNMQQAEIEMCTINRIQNLKQLSVISIE
jgi:hypothetical protein